MARSIELEVMVAAFAALAAACSASGGGVSPYAAGGSSSSSAGGSNGTCSPGNCSSCGSCFEMCVCATGNAQGCVEACGSGSGGGPGGGGNGGGSGAGFGAASGAGAGGAPGGAAGSPAGGSGGLPPGGAGGDGATAGTGGAGSGGAGGGPGGCQYPQSGYGTQIGSVLSPNLQWDGFLDGSASASTISVQQFFDCDGTKGINALLILQSATWCGSCQEEATQLNAHMAGGWGQNGIAVLTLMIEDQYSLPATISTASGWKNAFQAQGWSVAADPGFSFASNGSNGLPIRIVVDPRTMRIVSKEEGYSPYHPDLEQLASQNAH